MTCAQSCKGTCYMIHFNLICACVYCVYALVRLQMYIFLYAKPKRMQAHLAHTMFEVHLRLISPLLLVNMMAGVIQRPSACAHTQRRSQKHFSLRSAGTRKNLAIKKSGSGQDLLMASKPTQLILPTLAEHIFPGHDSFPSVCECPWFRKLQIVGWHQTRMQMTASWNWQRS